MQLTVTKDLSEENVTWKLEEDVAYYNHPLYSPWGTDPDFGIDGEYEEPYGAVTVSVEDTDLDSAFRTARRLINDFVTDNR
jgi:hypothetical protein